MNLQSTECEHLLDNVKKCGDEALEVEHERYEFAFVELGGRGPRAIDEIEAEAYEQELGYFDKVVPPLDLAYGKLNEAFERRVGDEREALVGVVDVH